jgi:hypothetical protein
VAIYLLQVQSSLAPDAQRLEVGGTLLFGASVSTEVLGIVITEHLD